MDYRKKPWHLTEEIQFSLSQSTQSTLTNTRTFELMEAVYYVFEDRIKCMNRQDEDWRWSEIFLNSNSQSSHKRLAIVMFGSCLINVKIKFFNVRTLSYVRAKFEHPNSWYTRQYNALLKTDLFHIQLHRVLTIVPERGCVRHLLYFFPLTSTRRHYFFEMREWSFVTSEYKVTCFSYPGSFNFSRVQSKMADTRVLDSWEKFVRQ